MLSNQRIAEGKKIWDFDWPNPRAATSVATRMDDLPERNSIRQQSKWRTFASV